MTTNDAPDPPSPDVPDKYASTVSAEYPLPPFVTTTESTKPSQLQGAVHVPELAHVSQTLADGLHPETHVVPVHEHWLLVASGTVAVHAPSVHAHLHLTDWPLVGITTVLVVVPHVELFEPVHLT